MLPPRFSPWLRLVWFSIGAAVGQAAFGAIIIAALSVAATLSGQNPDTLREEGVTRYALWMSVLSYPPIWLWLMFCRRHFDRRSVRSLGLRLESWGRSLGGGVLAGTLAISWLFGLLWLCGGVRFNGISPDAFDQTPTAIAGYLLLYAGAFACVGLMEEVIFRGYALHNLSASLGLRRAIWLQAIVFALIHLGNAAVSTQGVTDAETVRAIWLDALRGMPSIALIGAIFALCWAKTGSLWFPIGFHAAWNFCLGCVFSLPVSGLQTFRVFDISPVGNPWLNGGSFGAEGSVLLWPLLGVLCWALHRVPDHPQVAHDLALLDPNQKFAAVPIASTVTPVIETDEVEREADEEPHQSRFKTSMRQKEVDEEAPISIWGQLPRENTTASTWSPSNSTSEPIVQPDLTPTGEAPIPSTTREEWRFSELARPARESEPPREVEPELAPVETQREVSSAPVEVGLSPRETLPVETPPSETRTTETSLTENTEPSAPIPTPRPPAPRW